MTKGVGYRGPGSWQSIYRADELLFYESNVLQERLVATASTNTYDGGVHLSSDDCIGKGATCPWRSKSRPYVTLMDQVYESSFVPPDEQELSVVSADSGVFETQRVN
jgi:hypothetical protein